MVVVLRGFVERHSGEISLGLLAWRLLLGLLVIIVAATGERETRPRSTLK